MVIIVACYTYNQNWLWGIFLGLLYFLAHSSIRELIIYRTKFPKETSTSKKINPESWWKNKQKAGGMIAHLGFVCFFLGVTGNFFQQEKAFTLSPGEQIEMGKYSMSLREIGQRKLRNATEIVANIDLFEQEKPLVTMQPGKAFYPTSNEPTTEVSIYRRLLEDVYLSLSSINEDGSVSIQAYINPLVSLVPISLLFFLVGTIFSLLHQNKKE